jgi:hypothetical protein
VRLCADEPIVITATHLPTQRPAQAAQIDRSSAVIWASAVGFSLGFWVMALTAVF